MSPPKKIVLVTGFGLFGDYEVNSSWVAVKELSDMGLEMENVKLEIKEIPVTYEAIDKKIPQLLKKHNPVLVVHVGVSGIATALTLEQCAHNTGYNKSDVAGKCPKRYCCKKNGPAFLKTSLNLQEIMESPKVKGAGLTMTTSHDAGRFCCDYIYYSSLALRQEDGHVLFVHVPPLNQPFNGKTLATGLRAIIQASLDQIS